MCLVLLFTLFSVIPLEVQARFSFGSEIYSRFRHLSSTTQVPIVTSPSFYRVPFLFADLSLLGSLSDPEARISANDQSSELN